jgi:O-antigen/teichoic acid export membrane protein
LNKNKLSGQSRDLLWYFAGNLIPLIIGLIKSPVFTRYFIPAEYGYYSLTFIAFNYLSIAFFTSVSSIIWRFYFKYEKEGRLQPFKTMIFMLVIISGFLISMTGSVWYNLSSNPLLKKLILLCVIHFITSEIININLVFARIKGKAVFYNLLQSFRFIFSFILLFYLTFYLGKRIDSLLTSTIAINIIILIWMMIAAGRRFSYKPFKLYELKEIIAYGLVSVVANFCLVLLATSDRYIIKIFDSIEHVGIYNQVYNIGLISIGTLVNVFFTALNPYILKILEDGDDKSGNYILKYVFRFVYFMLPLTVFLSFFARPLADLLLGSDFRVGYNMIPYILVSSLLYGFTMFHETRLKFQLQYRKIIIGFVLALLLNVILNLICIPAFGYKTAAITTLLSYIFLFLFFYSVDTLRYLINTDFIRFTGLFVLVLALECILLHLVNTNFTSLNKLPLAILEGFLALFLSYFVIHFSGVFRKIHFKPFDDFKY